MWWRGKLKVTMMHLIAASTCWGQRCCLRLHLGLQTAASQHTLNTWFILMHCWPETASILCTAYSRTRLQNLLMDNANDRGFHAPSVCHSLLSSLNDVIHWTIAQARLFLIIFHDGTGSLNICKKSNFYRNLFYVGNCYWISTNLAWLKSKTSS